MRIGVSLRTGYPPGAGRTEAGWLVERARTVSDAGLHSLFVGDHHVDGPATYYQNVALLGRLLAEWHGPVAGALFLVPLWNPVVLAELVGTLATLTASRFVVLTGLGDERQLRGVGEPTTGRARRLEASIDLMRRLLSGETVTEEVGDRRFEDATIGPVAPEPVEFWMGGSVEPAIDRAARIGDGFVANVPHLPEELRAQATRYAETCAQLGKPTGVTAVRRNIYVGTDARDVERVAGPLLAKAGPIPADAHVVGEPEAVAEQLRALAAGGYTDAIVREMAVEHADVLASFERLARVQELVADA